MINSCLPSLKADFNKRVSKSSTVIFSLETLLTQRSKHFFIIESPPVLVINIKIEFL